MKVMNERYVVTSHPCPTCNETKTVSISSSELFAYHQGAYAQDVLSDYDADVRERFITGICGTCWDEMFSDDGHCVDCDDYHEVDMPCEDE
jgi:hypothetical protein